MSLIKDITDERFGSLTVLNLDYKKKSKWGSRTYWLCKCDCGNEKSVRKDHLTSGGHQILWVFGRTEPRKYEIQTYSWTIENSTLLCLEFNENEVQKPQCK